MTKPMTRISSTSEFLAKLDRELAEADRPSWEVDRKLGILFMGWVPKTIGGHRYILWDNTVFPDHSDSNHPHYTENLYDALDLCKTATCDGFGGYADWVLSKTNGGLTISAHVGDTKEEVFGETPAIALCRAVIHFILREKRYIE